MPGTGSANITLVLYLVVLVPLMLLGFYFARRKMFFPHHKMVMTGVVILNWILIFAVMAGSFRSGVMPGLPGSLSDIRILLPTIHLLTGAIAQLSATYLVILMWTERTPYEKLVPFRIKKIKTPMRVTLSLWLITVLLGFGIYGTWYGGSSAAEGSTEPVATEEATAESQGVATEAAVEPQSTEDTVATEAVVEPQSTENVVATEAAPDPAATEDSDG
jgi:uncharacterized membrane protein YozB (DUF420 family)